MNNKLMAIQLATVALIVVTLYIQEFRLEDIEDRFTGLDSRIEGLEAQVNKKPRSQSKSKEAASDA